MKISLLFQSSRSVHHHEGAIIMVDAEKRRQWLREASATAKQELWEVKRQGRFDPSLPAVSCMPPKPRQAMHMVTISL